MSYSLLATRELYEALLVLVALIAWWLLFIEERNYQIDLLRQKLFDIRSRLFYLAKDHDLFSEPAYRVTRTTLNGAIRFAHELNLPRLIGIFITERYFSAGDTRAKRYIADFEQALNVIPAFERNRIAKLNTEFHIAVILKVIGTSILLAPLFYVVRPILRSFHMLSKVSAKIVYSKAGRERFATIDAEVHHIGTVYAESRGTERRAA